MKTAALDTGDVWTGIALSDALGITAKPYTTIKTTELQGYLDSFIQKESVTTIIVGHPKTMRGTKSTQTEKVDALFVELQKKFPSVHWKLWDERLSSKRAADLKQAKTKQEKIESHAIAAAFILSSYLSFAA